MPSNEERKDDFKQMNEVEILKELHHPNIIEYCGYFVGEDFTAKPCGQQCLHIMMEFAEGGDF